MIYVCMYVYYLYYTNLIFYCHYFYKATQGLLRVHLYSVVSHLHRTVLYLPSSADSLTS